MGDKCPGTFGAAPRGANGYGRWRLGGDLTSGRRNMVSLSQTVAEGSHMV